MTQKRVKELFDYNEVTGVFTRKITVSNRAKKGAILSSKCNGYYETMVDGERIYLHRLAWFYKHGVMPKFIDHINGNKLDNSMVNIRNIDKKDNHKNMSKPKTNKSGHIGVYKHTINNVWIANICIDGKTKYLGSFDDINLAIEARKKAEKDNNFHSNHGR